MYFSPNTKQAVDIPDEPNTEEKGIDLKYNIDFFTKPQWFRGREYAWLSMVPRTFVASQHGSIIDIFKSYNLPTTVDRVSNTSHSASSRNEGTSLLDTDSTTRFVTPEHISRNWRSFEDNATAVIGHIFTESYIEHAQILCPPLPSVMGGYLNRHRTQHVALRQAFASRAWFNVLIGALIYACKRCEMPKLTQGGKEVLNPPPPSEVARSLTEPFTDLRFLPLWFVRVAAARPDLMPFLSLLRLSFTKRILSDVLFAGMFIHIKDAPTIGNLGFFVEYRVPIAYPWGDEEEAFVKENPHYACYRPPASLVKIAIAQKHAQATATSHVASSNIDVHASLGPEFAFEYDVPLDAAPFDIQVPDRPPTPSSLRSSHPEERQTMQEFFELRSDMAKSRRERQSDAQRLESDARVASRNTLLFFWRENSASRMIRVQVHSRYRRFFEDKNSGYQRRYDPHYDQVDYAVTFDPRPEDMMGSVQTFDSESLARLDRQMRFTYRNRIPELLEVERTEDDWSTDSVIEIAHHRFGFIQVPDLPTRSQQEANSLWIEVRKALQLPSTSPELCPQVIVPYISNMVTFFDGFKVDPRVEEGEIASRPGPPVQLWDLHPASFALRSSTAVRDLVRISPTHTLIGRAENCRWSLVVLNDLDALHACRLREAGLNVQDIAWHFLDRGIPCRTMVPFAGPHPEIEHNPLAIEVRIGGYKFTESDYRSYLNLRRSILLRPGVAFVAFKEGGIVWRIAREECGKLDVASLEAGPDLSGHLALSRDVVGWVDNQLSAEEIAAICGVYHVPVGA